MRVSSDREACSIRVRLARPLVGAALGAVWLCVIAAGFSPLKPISQSEFVLGQRPFSPSSSWNTPIAAGAAYTKLNWPAPNGYNYGVAWESYAPSIRQGSALDPMVSVAYPPGWGYVGGLLHVRMPLDANGAAGTDGELRLMRRGAEFSIMLGSNELMNSRLNGSEAALATLAARKIEKVAKPHVLIGGLGMGFTLRAALAVLGSKADIVVAELVPADERKAAPPKAMAPAVAPQVIEPVLLTQHATAFGAQ